MPVRVIDVVVPTAGVVRVTRVQRRGGAARVLDRACGAGPDDRVVREARNVPEAIPEPIAQRVEFFGCDGAHRTTALAAEVLVLAVAHERVQPRPVAEVNMLHEPVTLEHVEDAIDRGEVQIQRAGEVLRGAWPVCSEQRLQNEPARRRNAETAATHLAERLGKVAELQARNVWGARHVASRVVGSA